MKSSLAKILPSNFGFSFYGIDSDFSVLGPNTVNSMQEWLSSSIFSGLHFRRFLIILVPFDCSQASGNTKMDPASLDLSGSPTL